MFKTILSMLLIPAMVIPGIRTVTAGAEAQRAEETQEMQETAVLPEEAAGEAVEEEPVCLEGQAPIGTEIPKRRVAVGELFSVTFSAGGYAAAFDDFSYDASGFEAVSVKETEQGEIKAELRTLNETEKTVFTLYVDFTDGSRVEPQVFGCVNEYGVFLSNSSYDDAWSYYLGYLTEQGIVTEEEAEEMQIEQTQQYVRTEVFTTEGSGVQTRAAADTWVKGKLQWEDDDGVLHPLQFMYVNVWDNDVIAEDSLGQVYTDENGEFSVGFNNQTHATEEGGCDPVVDIVAMGPNLEIGVMRENGDGYQTRVTCMGNVSTGSTTTVNMTFTMDNDLGRAFQIHQAAVITSEYVKEMDDTDTKLGKIDIIYPDSGSNCYYTREGITPMSGGAVHITGAASKAGSPESYAAWDVIGHEYGHHVQRVFDITDTPGGGHTINLSMTEHYAQSDHSECGCANPGSAQAKYEGIRLAWGESWNTILAIMAQQYYIDILSDIKYVGDASYSANNIKYPLNWETGEAYYGEGCEGTLCSVLYDLYDPANETHDTVSWGHKKFFEVSVDSNAKTFSEFADYCISNNKVTEIALGKILSQYQIAPYNFKLRTVLSATVLPRFTWKKGNGSTGSDYQNNRFQVVFFNSSGREILRTATTTSESYTLTMNEWNTILNSSGSTFTAGVYGYQTSYPETGEYLSNTITINKPSKPTTETEYKIKYVICGETKTPTQSGKSTYTRLKDTVFWQATPSDTTWYVFDGWYKNANYTEKVTSTADFKAEPGFVLGDITVYGRWKYVRPGQFTVTDDGEFDHPSDWIDLKKATGYSLAQLKAKGYKSITFTGEITVWQKDDGYKYVQVYDGSSSGAKKIGEWWVDHRDGKSKKVYKLNNSGAWTINLSDLTNDIVCFWYTASGTFSDTWYNNNCWIAVQSLNK